MKINQRKIESMTGGLKDLKIKDLLLGIAAPIIVCLVIIWFPLNENFLTRLGFGGVLRGILVGGAQETIMIVAVPMLLGLTWNKWAGGASGFLLGSIFALWYSLSGVTFQGWINNLSLLGYVLSAMLIGYMAGALNQKSTKLTRLLFSGIVAGVSGGLFLFLTAQLSRYNFIPLYLAMLPRIIFGIVIPLIAWYVLRHVEKQKLKNSAAPIPHT
jgi:hypothetical protein